MVESLPLPIPQVDARLLTVRIDGVTNGTEQVWQSLARVSPERFAENESTLSPLTIARTGGPNAGAFCDPFLLPEFCSVQSALYQALNASHDTRLTAGWRIRCHGDLHLGKLLISGRTILLPSFEGDRSRPVSERRIKFSPLRDIASLIRSLDYVAGVIRLDLLDAPGQNPLAVRSADAAALEAPALAWYDRLGYECWTAYNEAVAPAQLLPAVASARQLALALELLDRTLREATFDVSLRSQRALISLAALLRLIAHFETLA